MPSKKPLVIKEDNSYSFSQIDKYAYNNGFFVDFHGPFLVGEHFMVLKHPSNDNVVSFVLTGSSVVGSTFKCVYSDV
jgi:hypothetical protein